ncbi:MAG: hypothetical protein HZC42_15335 [Candidatus Eisenbacteria bacterium]|nr:hypothetical protein [Candidatus Eisenbacteria bacterium]
MRHHVPGRPVLLVMLVVTLVGSASPPAGRDAVPAHFGDGMDRIGRHFPLDIVEQGDSTLTAVACLAADLPPSVLEVAAESG